jgi:hypothetical protein
MSIFGFNKTVNNDRNSEICSFGIYSFKLIRIKLLLQGPIWSDEVYDFKTNLLYSLQNLFYWIDSYIQILLYFIQIGS